MAYDLIYRHGGWTVYNDEEWFIEERLKLGSEVETLLTQGRSKGISVWMGAQRPVEVSRFVLSQATHVLCAAVEGRDAKTVEWATTPRIRPVLEELNYEKHEFAWFHRPSRSIWKGRIQDLGGRI